MSFYTHPIFVDHIWTTAKSTSDAFGVHVQWTGKDFVLHNDADPKWRPCPGLAAQGHCSSLAAQEGEVEKNDDACYMLTTWLTTASSISCISFGSLHSQVFDFLHF